MGNRDARESRDASIYHLAVESDFRAGLDADDYRPADLDAVGFVHCATRPSVLPIAADYFADAAGPVLVVEIDPARLESEVRYEAPAPIAGGGTSHLADASVFPHVYGPITRRAITRVGVLGRSAEGFGWPRRLVALESFLGDA